MDTLKKKKGITKMCFYTMLVTLRMQMPTNIKYQSPWMTEKQESYSVTLWSSLV